MVEDYWDIGVPTTYVSSLHTVSPHLFRCTPIRLWPLRLELITKEVSYKKLHVYGCRHCHFIHVRRAKQSHYQPTSATISLQWPSEATWLLATNNIIIFSHIVMFHGDCGGYAVEVQYRPGLRIMYIYAVCIQYCSGPYTLKRAHRLLTTMIYCGLWSPKPSHNYAFLWSSP